MKSYRYSIIERYVRRIYRVFFPVPKSPWTDGYVDDICSINLVPQQQMVAFFGKCIDYLRSVKGQDYGDYLEFGVFNGNSMGSMYIAANQSGLGQTRFFGFDSFEGLPPGSDGEDSGVWKEGFYSCTLDQTRQCLGKRGIDHSVINWVPGWYDKTLNNDLINRFNINNIGIVFIDCDTYSSSKVVLDFIAPLVNQTMIICFDDWKLNDLDIKGMGEYRAFNEFMDNNPMLEAHEIKSYNRKSKTFILRKNN